MNLKKRLFIMLLAAMLCLFAAPKSYANNIALSSPTPTSNISSQTDKDAEEYYSKIGEAIGGGLIYLIGGIVCAAVAVIGLKIITKRRDNAGPDTGDASKPEYIHISNITEPLPGKQPWEMPEVQPVPMYLFLECRGGYQDGREFPLTHTIKIGRTQDNDIKYPDDWPGISRHHAIISLTELTGTTSVVELTDISSTEIYLKKGSRGENKANPIPKNTPVRLECGDVFYLGNRENRFELIGRATGFGNYKF